MHMKFTQSSYTTFLLPVISFGLFSRHFKLDSRYMFKKICNSGTVIVYKMYEYFVVVDCLRLIPALISNSSCVYRESRGDDPHLYTHILRQTFILRRCCQVDDCRQQGVSQIKVQITIFNIIITFL